MSQPREVGFLIHSTGDGWPGQVAYIGLRRGNKLREELVFESERKMGMEGCLTVVETPRLTVGELSAFINELSVRIMRRDLPGLLRAVHSVIPEYVPSTQFIGQALSVAGHA